MSKEAYENNVLIVTRDFPPYSPIVGWFIRIASLANYFASKNIEVHVLLEPLLQSCFTRASFKNRKSGKIP